MVPINKVSMGVPSIRYTCVHLLLNIVVLVELVLVADVELDTTDAVVDIVDEAVVTLEVTASVAVPDADVETASSVVDETVADLVVVPVLALVSSCRATGCTTRAKVM